MSPENFFLARLPANSLECLIPDVLRVASRQVDILGECKPHDFGSHVETSLTLVLGMPLLIDVEESVVYEIDCSNI